MSRKVETVDVFALALLGGAAAVTAALYARLPVRVPTHFDLHGVANGWMDRSTGAWVLLGTGAAVWALLRFGGALLPSAWRARAAATPMGAVAFLLAAFFTSLQILVLYAATNPGEPIGRGLAIACGAMWLALAQLMPRLRRNPFVGVRTVWTLTSDENWLRTHRVAAYAFAGGGVVALVAGLVGGASASALAIFAVLVSGMVPVVYSYLLARRLPPQG